MLLNILNNYLIFYSMCCVWLFYIQHLGAGIYGVSITLENDVCICKNGTEFRRMDGNECSVLNEGDMWGFSMCHSSRNHINYLEYLFARGNKLYM